MNHHPFEPVLIIGCGDIGQRVARLELAAGHLVHALSRSAERAEHLGACGLHPVLGDLDHPDTLKGRLPAAGTLYYFAPPPPVGDEDPRLAALLATLPAAAPPRRIVYISTSGIYGDCQGAWIDESRPPAPRSARARRRLDAERRVRHYAEANGTEWVILRVPGIYGPGRLPLERLRQGLPVVRASEAPWSNRIHADDLAAACFAAATETTAHGVYNASDGQPSTMTDYFLRVADLLGLPHPPEIGLDEARRVLSPSMLSFLEESKRLVNRRMLTELRVQLRYPTLAEGLPACLRS